MALTASAELATKSIDGKRNQSAPQLDSLPPPDASPQKMPSDDFEQHSSKANDVLKDNAQPPDCSDGSLGKQAELKRTNRVAAWEENPDKEVNTHGSSDKNVNAE